MLLSEFENFLCFEMLSNSPPSPLWIQAELVWFPPVMFDDIHMLLTLNMHLESCHRSTDLIGLRCSSHIHIRLKTHVTCLQQGSLNFRLRRRFFLIYRKKWWDLSVVSWLEIYTGNNLSPASLRYPHHNNHFFCKDFELLFPLYGFLNTLAKLTLNHQHTPYLNEANFRFSLCCFLKCHFFLSSSIPVWPFLRSDWPGCFFSSF